MIVRNSSIKFRNGDKVLSQGGLCACEICRDVCVSVDCGYQCVCVCVCVCVRQRESESEIGEERLWINSDCQVTVHHIRYRRINDCPQFYRLNCVPIKIHM